MCFLVCMQFIIACYKILTCEKNYETKFWFHVIIGLQVKWKLISWYLWLLFILISSSFQYQGRPKWSFLIFILFISALKESPSVHCVGQGKTASLFWPYIRHQLSVSFESLMMIRKIWRIWDLSNTVIILMEGLRLCWHQILVVVTCLRTVMINLW